MKEAIRKYCDCGSSDFTVYYYEDGTLDYIECSKCGMNIDWGTESKALEDKIDSKDRALNRLIVSINKLRDKIQRRNIQIKDLKAENLKFHQSNGKLGSVILDIKEAMDNDQYLTVREILNA